MRGKTWVNLEDVVLIEHWENMNDGERGSIIYKYTDDEVRKLRKRKEFDSREGDIIEELIIREEKEDDEEEDDIQDL
eukprot:CAMPEP_0117425416 /NCGR_PEP_ID=MMETSP0758-20121206/5673_1 /TAXON_ID=63605 /ORGANISM="Percolomonas cosmopolitus, Strain AE-1 (ATCC 50343)" /LENGTH=76 /DNA_ID=CAMNT_0005209849 /DNA_START=238 /DNA_END=468 /DNA_ORIENTATION=+